MQQSPTVVLVDDEEMVITSLKAFLALETEFNVEGFTDPEAAVTFITGNPVDVVVSDYLMPRLSGIQLLKKSKDVRPEATRILLTGHADKNSAIQAINEVSLYQYIEKPWDNEALLMVIRNGAERAQLLRQLRDSESSLMDVRARLLRAFL